MDPVEQFEQIVLMEERTVLIEELLIMADTLCETLKRITGEEDSAE